MWKKGPPTTHPLDEYVTPLLGYTPSMHHTIICDRWHIGEAIYPFVMGRNSKMDLGVFWYIERFLASKGASITVLRPPLNTLLKRYIERGDGYVKYEQMTEICRRYDRYGYHSERVRTADDVVANAEGTTTRALGLDNLVTYVGPPAPGVVYVGDVRNCTGAHCAHRQRHSVYGTAFMPYTATSGHYLANAIVMGNAKNDGIGIINACDVDDIRAAYETLGRPLLIALGTRASRRLTARGLDHAAAPHPQFIRRFHHKAMHAYGRLLFDLIGTERNELQWRPSSAPRTASARTPTSLIRS